MKTLTLISTAVGLLAMGGAATRITLAGAVVVIVATVIALRRAGQTCVYWRPAPSGREKETGPAGGAQWHEWPAPAAPQMLDAAFGAFRQALDEFTRLGRPDGQVPAASCGCTPLTEIVTARAYEILGRNPETKNKTTAGSVR